MKKQIVMSIALTTVLLTIPAVVHAQEREFGERGVTEISGGISFSSITPVSNGTTSDATTLLSFGPEIGYFIVDGFELGFSPGMSLLPGISVVTPASGEGTTILQLFVSPSYNIPTEGKKVTPFFQVPFGYTSMSSGNFTESGFSWGIKGGVKIVATGHLLVNVYGEYLQLSFTPEKATERSGFDFLSFGVSVGGFF